MNGGRSASTEILLDGVDNTDTYSASTGQTIPMDSVQEYSVITNGFDAQYGRASGGVVNLGTVAGTNQFHGSVYEYNRVSALAANTYNEDAVDASLRSQGLPINPRDHFTRNQFGFAVGGPILRDKLFFFTNYEWNRIRSTGAQEFEVPSASFLASAAPATQAFFKAYGSALTPGTIVGNTIPVAGFASDPLQLVTVNTSINAGAGSPVNAFFGDSRFDYNPTDRLSMFFRGATYNDAYPSGYVSLSPFNGFSTGQSDFDQSYLYSVSYVITPSLVSTSKIGFSREMKQEPLSTAGIAPSLYLNKANIAIADTVPVFRWTSQAIWRPLRRRDSLRRSANTYQFLEDLGSPTAAPLQGRRKYIQTRDNRTYGAYENAIEQVAKNGTHSDPRSSRSSSATSTPPRSPSIRRANLPTPVTPLNAQRNLRLLHRRACLLAQLRPRGHLQQRQLVLSRTSIWRFDDRLTINAGLRSEFFGVQHNNDPSLDSNFYLGTGNNIAEQVATGQVMNTPNSPVGGLIAKQLNNYAPRVGFAFDPHGRRQVGHPWRLRHQL